MNSAGSYTYRIGVPAVRISSTSCSVFFLFSSLLPLSISRISTGTLPSGRCVSDRRHFPSTEGLSLEGMITETLSSLANSSLASSAALAASSTDSFADSAAVRYSSQGFCSSSAFSRLGFCRVPAVRFPQYQKCRETALLPDVQWYDSLSQIHRPPETAGPSGDGSLPLSKKLFPCRCSLLLSQPRLPQFLQQSAPHCHDASHIEESR